MQLAAKVRAYPLVFVVPVAQALRLPFFETSDFIHLIVMVLSDVTPFLREKQDKYVVVYPFPTKNICFNWKMGLGDPSG